ncbi:MAG: NUDIX hydrolase [Bacteroidetes bacterium HGW-Bacteroidetes-6]|jgi:8-oxo-dGTP pyrophosphatase MutT (NUDIX family)|nr:MAG: NUDIX hydrolase [Bacteroidetes bacterium HGW-Bacteroidetes-6]
MKKANKTYPFSIRVYGILVFENQLLVTEEKWFDMRMIKFPGGGLEYGESTIEALKREFREECGTNIEVKKLLHIPGQFIPAIFYEQVQVIPIYYSLEVSNVSEISIAEKWHSESEMQNGDVYFHWISLKTLKPELFSFSGDREMAALLQPHGNSHIE